MAKYWEIYRNGILVMGIQATYDQICALMVWYLCKGILVTLVLVDAETGRRLPYTEYREAA